MTDYRSRLRELEERTRQEFGGQLEIQLVLEEEAPLPWGLRVYLVALDGRFDVAARFASPWFLEPRDDAMGFLFAVGALAKRQDLGDFVPRQDWDSSYQPPAVAHGSHSGVDVVNRLRPDFGAHSWMPENHAHGERSWSPYKRYSHRLLDVLFDGSYTADSGEQIETMSPEMDPRWTVCIYADPKRPRFRPTFSPDEGELHLAGTVDELTLIRPQGWKSGVSPRDLDAWVRIDVTGTIEDTMDRLLEIILEPFSKTTEVNLPFMENIFQVSEDGLFIFYPLALHPGSESNESIELGVTVQAPFLTTGWVKSIRDNKLSPSSGQFRRTVGNIARDIVEVADQSLREAPATAPEGGWRAEPVVGAKERLAFWERATPVDVAEATDRTFRVREWRRQLERARSEVIEPE